MKACLAQVGQRIGVFARRGLFVGLLPVFVALFLTLLRLFRFLVFMLFLGLAVGTGRFELLLVLFQVRQESLRFDCGLGQCGNETRIQLLRSARGRERGDVVPSLVLHSVHAGVRRYGQRAVVCFADGQDQVRIPSHHPVDLFEKHD